MSTISRWVLVGVDNVEQDYEYDDYTEAQADAEERGIAVVERTYEYTDSELVWAPDGASTWPPRGKGK